MTAPAITEAEVMAVIGNIEAGKVTVACVDEWGISGDVLFKASNGWSFVVFNDCGEWDYFDHIVAPDNRIIDYSADMCGEDRGLLIDDAMPLLTAYRPHTLAQYTAWDCRDGWYWYVRGLGSSHFWASLTEQDRFNRMLTGRLGECLMAAMRQLVTCLDGTDTPAAKLYRESAACRVSAINEPACWTGDDLLALFKLGKALSAEAIAAAGMAETP